MPFSVHSGLATNGNGLADGCDFEMGLSRDGNANAIPDECECLTDVTGDLVVDVQDMVAVITAWGRPGGPADVNLDGIVDVLDLVELILGWGACSRMNRT